MHKVLIVEDNLILAKTIAEFLGRKNYLFRIVTDGAQGLRSAKDANYDLLILDIVLPHVGGLQIAASVRAAGLDTAILMLTEKNEIDDVVDGFAHGADAYLGKPFNYRELKSRVDGLLRRPPQTRKRELHLKDLCLDLSSYQVSMGSKQIVLRKKEIDILRFLLEHLGQVVTREQLFNNVWGEHSSAYTSTIDVHMSNIRRKLSRAGSGASRMIHTVHGRGYKISA